MRALLCPMVAADVAPLEPVCSALADALPRLAVALGLPAGVAARMRSRLADFEGRAGARTLAFDPCSSDVHVCSGRLGLSEARALVSARATREPALELVLDALGNAAGDASARIVERLGPSDTTHVELHLDLGPLGLGAWPLVESVLAALGLRRAWHHVLEGAPRGPLLDECVGLGLHLDDVEPSRIEIRIRRRDVSADVLVAAARGLDPRRAMQAFFRLTGGEPGRGGLAPTTSWCFDLGGTGEPTAMRMALPIRAWARDDEDVCARMDALRVRDDGGRIARAVLSTILARGLGQRSAAIGIELEWRGADERVRVESSPEEFDDEPGESLALASDASPWASHPLLVRLERDVLMPTRAWAILAEVYAAILEPSARRWAGLVARVDDDAARCALAHELAVDLGLGDVEHSVVRRFRRLLAASPGAPSSGSRLSARLDAVFADEHPYVGVGAAIAARRFAIEVTSRVAAVLRRHGHDDVAGQLEGLSTPRELACATTHDADRRAIGRGERAVLAAAWTALDDLDRAL